MEKNFDLFISQLSETNATLDYFTDFEKVIRNTNKIAIKLNQLNYLIGKEDLRKAIKELFEENPKVFEVLDILLAVRTKDKKKTLNSNGEFVLLESYFTSLQGVIDYIEQTGLAEVFKNKNVTNLVDYVFGVEVIALAVAVCDLIVVIPEYAPDERVVTESDKDAVRRDLLNEGAERLYDMLHVLEVVGLRGGGFMG